MHQNYTHQRQTTVGKPQDHWKHVRYYQMGEDSIRNKS
jgi:hypothetical protein